MTYGSWTVCTLYLCNGRIVAAEKNYNNRSVAESHYNKMTQRLDVSALLLQHPNGATVRQFQRERDNV